MMDIKEAAMSPPFARPDRSPRAERGCRRNRKPSISAKQLASLCTEGFAVPLFQNCAGVGCWGGPDERSCVGVVLVEVGFYGRYFHNDRYLRIPSISLAETNGGSPPQ